MTNREIPPSDSDVISRFGVLETAQLAVIAKKFFEVSPNGADLHLVIAEFPCLNHPNRTRMPPLGLVRADLLDKPLVPRRLDLIPSIPACRFLFLGDERLMGRFDQLAREATVLLRRLMPFLHTRISDAGPDAPFWRANLWPWLMMNIFENADPTGLLCQLEWHPWEVHPTIRQPGRSAIGEALFLTFTYDAFASSGHALMALFHQYGADEIAQHAFVVPTDTRPDNTSGPAPKSSLKEPSKLAFQCYRFSIVLGQTQKAIAKSVYADASAQGRVSKSIRAVKAWIEAGNILPEITEERPTVTPLDPAKLDNIPRSDRHRPESPKRE